MNSPRMVKMRKEIWEFTLVLLPNLLVRAIDCVVFSHPEPLCQHK